MIALVFVLLLLVVGIMLLFRGMRGRVVGDHPICRKCGFDLFGLPKESTRCSECGTDITAKRAVRIGRRERRRMMAGAGLLLVMVSLGVIVIAISDVLQDVEWIQFEPLWYVRKQAKDTSATVRDPALLEIARRMAAGNLSDADVKTITADDLAVQANLNATWSAGRGDFIEAARKTGKISDADWRQYLMNTGHFTITARDQVRRGDWLPVRINELGARCGTNSNFWAEMHVVIPDDPLVDAQFRKDDGSNGSSINGFGSGSTMHNIRLDKSAIAATADGEKILRLRLHVDYFEKYNADRSKPVASKDYDLSAKWMLVPADAQTATPIKDETLRASVEKSVAVDPLKLHPTSWGPPGTLRLEMQIHVNTTPVELSHVIVLRSGAKEWPLNTGIYHLAGGSTTWGTGGDVKDFQIDGKPPATVDVVFRPSAKQAMETVEMKKYWDGEFVVKGVKVTVGP
jgi:hypothetical protein